jgi:thiol:disulfide interchange protein
VGRGEQVNIHAPLGSARGRLYLVAMFRTLKSFLAVLGFAALAPLALAQTGQTVKTENVQASLIAADAAVAPGQTAAIALRLLVRPKWHTYWINPGDSGAETTLDWTAPPGVQVGPIQWPVPKTLPLGPLVNYGYEGETIYPISVKVPANAKPGQTLELQAEAGWLVCEEICIPEGGPLSITLPVAAAARENAEWAATIAEAAAALPKKADAQARLTKSSDGATLTVAGADAKGKWANAYFFPLIGTAIDHAAPQAPEFGAEGVRLNLKKGTDGALGTQKLGGLLKFTDAEGREKAVMIEAAPGAALDLGALAPPARASGGGDSGGDLTLPLALVFAFIGGLILNVMPCVLPVLSLKALSLARGHDPAQARAQGLLFLAGVMATFLALAGALIALQSAGAAVGWGFQLQEPWFVGALALLFFVIGLNLLGVFEIGGSLQNVGGGLAQKQGAAGAFFTGALAVLAATPCTAPFMAGAMGFAATQPPAANLAVFAALGLGFATPMTALSFAPAVRAALPKPGAWMDRLKQFFAFPMFATAVWLAWVLAAQAGADGVLALLSIAVALAAILWAVKTLERPATKAAVAALALALAGGVVWTLQPQAQAAALQPQPWSAARVLQANAAGQTVFVNFTADWCVTCKVNERTALSGCRVAEAFGKAEIIYLKGDWTARDDVIAAELKAHGRQGVPLYIVYRPGAAPRVLPQILTEDLVIEAIAGL